MQSKVLLAVICNGIIRTLANITLSVSHWCPPSLNSTPGKLTLRRLFWDEIPAGEIRQNLILLPAIKLYVICDNTAVNQLLNQPWNKV